MPTKFKLERADIWLGILAGVLVALTFYKVIFANQSISHITLLASRDVLFRQFLNPTVLDYDESAAQLRVPYFFLTAQMLRQGVLPLWNPLCGTGVPMVGDIQSEAFSPLALLFALAPSLRTFNLLLIFQPIFCAVCTYFLARKLAISRAASIFAALTYSWCPFTVQQIELICGTAGCVLPLVALTMVNAAQSPSLRNTVICAAACAAFIISGHPEATFVGIGFTSILYLLLRRQPHLKSNLQALAGLAAIGALCFCFTAPLLLPLAEYLMNSDSYKFGHGVNHAYPWLKLTYNLLQPADKGEAGFLGGLVPILILGTAFAGKNSNRNSQAVGLVLILVAAIAMRPGLGEFLVATPLNLILGPYFMAVILLFTTLWAAMRLDNLLTGAINLNAGACLKGGLLALAAILMPLAVQILSSRNLMPADLLATLAPAPFHSRDLINNLVVLAIFALIVLALKKQRLSAAIAAIVLIVLSAGSELVATRLSLPNQPAFEYPQIDALTALQKSGKRSMGLGWDVFRANTNFVYSIPSLNIFNVLFPKRFRAFITSAGGEVSTFNVFMKDSPLPRLIDLASVKYALALKPVWGADDRPPEMKELAVQAVFVDEPELQLTAASLGYDPQKSQVAGEVVFQAAGQAEKYSYMVLVLDKDNQALWYGGLLPISQKSFSAMLPQTSRAMPLNSQIKIALRVFKSGAMKALTAKAVGATAGDTIELSRFATAAGSNSRQHYKLLDEYLPFHVRLYENTQALPEAYLVHRAIAANSADEALRQIKADSFKAGEEVVLEGAPALKEATTQATKPTETVSIKRPSCNEVELTVEAASPGYVVLTDTYYPGWVAEENGKQVSILRANYLFRATAVDAGKHIIRYKYQPLSFTVGAALFSLALLVAVFSLFAAPAAKKETN